ILLENHDNMLDRRLRLRPVWDLRKRRARGRHRERGCGHKRHRLAKAIMHIDFLLIFLGGFRNCRTAGWLLARTGTTSGGRREMGNTRLEVVGGQCYSHMNGESKLVSERVKNSAESVRGSLVGTGNSGSRK